MRGEPIGETFSILRQFTVLIDCGDFSRGGLGSDGCVASPVVARPRHGLRESLEIEGDESIPAE